VCGRSKQWNRLRKAGVKESISLRRTRRPTNQRRCPARFTPGSISPEPPQQRHHRQPPGCPVPHGLGCVSQARLSTGSRHLRRRTNIVIPCRDRHPGKRKTLIARGFTTPGCRSTPPSPSQLGSPTTTWRHGHFTPQLVEVRPRKRRSAPRTARKQPLAPGRAGQIGGHETPGARGPGAAAGAPESRAQMGSVMTRDCTGRGKRVDHC